MSRIIAAILVVIATAGSASADHYVRGHFRSNGSYVPGHMRSSPDSSFYNNYSTYGNFNPYTGSAGTRYYPSYRYQTYRPYSYSPYRGW